VLQYRRATLAYLSTQSEFGSGQIRLSGRALVGFDNRGMFNNPPAILINLTRSLASIAFSSRSPDQTHDQADALGRAEISACQRLRCLSSSGTASFAGFMKSTAMRPVMSATV